MLTAIRDFLRRRAIERAHAQRRQIAMAIAAAELSGDHAAARYFEAEHELATNKLRALRGDPNPGRYCCDHGCEEGRRGCPARDLHSQPRKATT